MLVQGCNLSKSATPDGGEGTQAIRNSVATRSAGEVAAIEGIVRVRGRIPTLPSLRTSGAVAKVCGEEIPDRTLAVNEGGGLADAIVFVADADALAQGGEAREAIVVDQRRCEYLPPVLAARAGAEIEIGNSDPLLHNVHAKNSAQLFNFAMPVQGIKVKKQLPSSPMTIHLACDVHPWMRAVIRTFNHPYFALTDPTGHYRLSAVPSGKKKLAFWHQRFPERTLETNALPSGPNRVDLEWSADELRL